MPSHRLTPLIWIVALALCLAGCSKGKTTSEKDKKNSQKNSSQTQTTSLPRDTVKTSVSLPPVKKVNLGRFNRQRASQIWKAMAQKMGWKKFKFEGRDRRLNLPSKTLPYWEALLEICRAGRYKYIIPKWSHNPVVVTNGGLPYQFYKVRGAFFMTIPYVKMGSSGQARFQLTLRSSPGWTKRFYKRPKYKKGRPYKNPPSPKVKVKVTWDGSSSIEFKTRPIMTSYGEGLWRWNCHGPAKPKAEKVSISVDLDPQLASEERELQIPLDKGGKGRGVTITECSHEKNDSVDKIKLKLKGKEGWKILKVVAYDQKGENPYPHMESLEHFFGQPNFLMEYEYKDLSSPLSHLGIVYSQGNDSLLFQWIDSPVKDVTSNPNPPAIEGTITITPPAEKSTPFAMSFRQTKGKNKSLKGNNISTYFTPQKVYSGKSTRSAFRSPGNTLQMYAEDGKLHYAIVDVPLGEYRVTLTYDNTYLVVLHKEFLVPNTKLNFNIDLTKAAKIDCLITDTNGQPLPKHQVYLYPLDIAGKRYSRYGGPSIRAKTDDQGRLKADHLAPGKYEIDVKKNYRSIYKPLPLELVGEKTHRDKIAVEKKAKRTSYRRRTSKPAFSNTTKTASSGPAISGAIRVLNPPKGRRMVKISYHKVGATTFGKGGYGLAGLGIDFSSQQSGWAKSSGVKVAAKKGQIRYEIEGIPPGRYILTAYLGDTFLYPFAVRYKGKPLVTDIVLDHRTTATIRAKVTDKKGRPLTNMRVTLQPRALYRVKVFGSGPDISGQTDKYGYLKISGLARGMYYLYGSKTIGRDAKGKVNSWSNFKRPSRLYLRGSRHTSTIKVSTEQ